MQLQIEYNQAPFQKQLCFICNELFKTTEAQVIVCNEQGAPYGEVCPHCLKEGFNRLSDRFDQLNQSRRTGIIRRSRYSKVSLSA